MAIASHWKTVLRPVWNAARSASIVDMNADVSKTLFLSSGARTGSTWVSEIINFDHAFRYLFEPFSMTAPLRPAWAPRLHPDDRLRYVRPDCVDADLIAQAERVVSGRLHHGDVDQYNYSTRIAFDKRLVKETKANLFLKWLHLRFPRMKLILLMRHPIPTVLSRLYKKSDADAAQRDADYRSLMFAQPELVADHLEPLRDEIESAKTVVEQRLAVWCVQNYVPLRQFAPDELHLMFYETLCMDPARELRRLYEFLGEDLDDERLGTALRRLQRPSSTVHREVTEFPEGWDVVSRWQGEASVADRVAAKRILGAFGLDAIYGDSPMPDVDGAAAFMLANRRNAAKSTS